MVRTIAKPPKMAPATKYGGKIVVCQPESRRWRSRIDTTECTERTSGVERPARIEIGHLVVAPVTIAPAPAQGKNAVGKLAYLRLGPIAQCGDIRNQARIPKQHRNSEVGADRENVPKQRTSKFGQMPLEFGTGAMNQAIHTRPM